MNSLGESQHAHRQHQHHHRHHRRRRFRRLGIALGLALVFACLAGFTVWLVNEVLAPSSAPQPVPGVE